MSSYYVAMELKKEKRENKWAKMEELVSAS